MLYDKTFIQAGIKSFSEEIAKALGTSNLAKALDNHEYIDSVIPMENEMLDLTEGKQTLFD